MKKHCLSIVSFLAITLIAALADDFRIQVDSGNLFVRNLKGDLIAEIPQGTVGKQVSVGSSQFLLTTLNKSIKTDGNAVVTIHYASNLETAEVDPGFIGKMQVSELNTPSTPTKVVSAPPAPTPTPVVKKEVKEAQVTQTTTQTVSSSPIAEVQTTEKKTANKDIFTLLKTEGVKGLFDSKNISTKDRQSTEPTLSGSITADSIKASETTSMGKMKSISPEILARASQDKLGDVRLVSIQGAMSVDGKPVHDEAMANSQSVIHTEENGSAIAIIGGVHLLTIDPKTEVTISQSLHGKTISTLVDLKSGSLFADVNKNEGYSQDFSIKTPNGVASATGSQAFVCFIDGKMIVAAFESPWKGKDGSGKEVFFMRPMVVPGENSFKTVSFSSIPAMSGLELQHEIALISAFLGDHMTRDDSRNSLVVFHPVASFVQGNSPTLPDGRTNPGATVEGTLRNLVASLLTDNLQSEEKDNGGELLVGDKRDPLVFNNFKNFEGGRNGQVTPAQTTPGGI
ncbi:MAG: FecR family protein [Verrucomicrobiota bacterium]